MKWQFHGRTIIRRCVQTERLLKTQLFLEKDLQPRLEVAEEYCQVIEAKVCKNKSKGYCRITSSWYLPHFYVVREDKETTKVRIVYDSVAIYGGISRNSMLPGPKLSKMCVCVFFFNALLRFCSYLVALVAKENILDYSVINFTKSIVLFSNMLQRWRNGKSNDQHCRTGDKLLFFGFNLLRFVSFYFVYLVFFFFCRRHSKAISEGRKLSLSFSFFLNKQQCWPIFVRFKFCI